MRRKRAKFTDVRANIGRIYMAIGVKKYLFTVEFSSFFVGEFRQLEYI